MRKSFIVVAVLIVVGYGSWLWWMRTGEWGLPVGSVVEVPPQTTGSNYLAIILSGDGGWADLDRDIGQSLSENGIAVLGFDVMKYFWKTRTPDEMSADIIRILRLYRKRWQKKQLILIGYSFGGDVMPFLINRLPDDIRPDVSLTVLLSPGRYANWEVRVGDWMTDTPHKDATPTVPEALRMKDIRMLCIYGKEEEEESLCPVLPAAMTETISKPGGHHFDGDYQALTADILHRLKH